VEPDARPSPTSRTPRANTSSTARPDRIQSPTVIDLVESQLLLQPHLVSNSKHIAYSDKHMRLWVVDVPSGKPVLIDKVSIAPSAQLWRSLVSDSKWIAYTRDLDNQLHAVFLYSMETINSPRSRTE